jgi:small subunit ribosomal protein S1
MAGSSVEKKALTATDASGKQVDLSDFEESFYRPGQVDEILKTYDKSLEGIEEGQVVHGRILRITDKEVIVDVNFKSEGIIPLSEFKNVQDFKPGDEINVFLEQVEDSEGQIILSKSRADFLKVWDRIYEAY